MCVQFDMTNLFLNQVSKKQYHLNTHFQGKKMTIQEVF